MLRSQALKPLLQQSKCTTAYRSPADLPNVCTTHLPFCCLPLKKKIVFTIWQVPSPPPCPEEVQELGEGKKFIVSFDTFSCPFSRTLI